MGSSRKEYWNGLPCPSPGDLPDPGIKPVSPALQADSLPLSRQGSPFEITASSETLILNQPPFFPQEKNVKNFVMAVSNETYQKLQKILNKRQLWTCIYPDTYLPH